MAKNPDHGMRKPSPPISAGDEHPTEANPSSAETGHLLTLRGLISKPVHGMNTEMARFSAECRTLEATVLQIDLDEIGYGGKLGQLPNPIGCSPSNPRIAKILRYYSDRCKNAFAAIPSRDLPREKWDTQFSDCQSALVMLRSTLATIARGPRTLEEITELRELADHLIADFAEVFTGMSPLGLKSLQATADRMSELDPRLVSAAKAGAMGAMLEAVMQKEARAKGDAEAEAPDWAAFEKRIALIEELNPSDSDLDALKRLAKTNGMTPDLVREDSRIRLERNPGDWHEQQIYAWANWRLGRKDEARSALREALKLEAASGTSRNTELHANWKAIQNPNATREDFKIQMKIGVGLTDLLQ
jgi:hypothetical protein